MLQEKFRIAELIRRIDIHRVLGGYEIWHHSGITPLAALPKDRGLHEGNRAIVPVRFLELLRSEMHSFRSQIWFHCPSNYTVRLLWRMFVWNKAHHTIASRLRENFICFANIFCCTQRTRRH